MPRAHAPAQAVGAELDLFQVIDCRAPARRPAALSLRRRLRPLDDESHRGAGTTRVVCMEVLEHVVDLTPVIERLWRLLAPRARCS